MVIFQFAGFRENVRRKKKPRKNYHEISPKYKAIFHNLVDGPMISQHVHQDFTKISWPSIYDVHWYCITSHQVSLVIKSYDGYTSDIFWWIFITRYCRISSCLVLRFKKIVHQEVVLPCWNAFCQLTAEGCWAQPLVKPLFPYEGCFGTFWAPSTCSSSFRCQFLVHFLFCL